MTTDNKKRFLITTLKRTNQEKGIIEYCNLVGGVPISKRRLWSYLFCVDQAAFINKIDESMKATLAMIDRGEELTFKTLPINYESGIERRFIIGIVIYFLDLRQTEENTFFSARLKSHKEIMGAEDIFQFIVKVSGDRIEKFGKPRGLLK